MASNAWIRAASILAPVLVVSVAWVLVVPWDLSDIDSTGRPRDGLDSHWLSVAAVGVAAAAIGLVAAATRGIAQHGQSIACAAMATWAGLLAWRAFSARMDGASLFLVPFVFVVLPLCVFVPWIAGRVGRMRQS